MLTALFESTRGMLMEEESWAIAVKEIVELLEGCGPELKDMMKVVVVHTLIGMLYAGKINENCYEEYASVIEAYVKELSEYDLEIQMIYAGFLLKKDRIVKVLSEQFFEIWEAYKKSEIINQLSVHFIKEKSDILEAIWQRAFKESDREGLLFNSMQWYLLDVLFLI